MNVETFQALLDRRGSDFADWPADAAEDAKKLLLCSEEARLSYDALRRLESLIEASRPRVMPSHADRVVRSALAEVARRDANPPFLQQLLYLLFAPAARAALAVGVIVIGFGLGMAIGNPTADTTPTFSNGSLMMTASADDVLF